MNQSRYFLSTSSKMRNENRVTFLRLIVLIYCLKATTSMLGPAPPARLSLVTVQSSIRSVDPMLAEVSVLSANNLFYEAFRAADLEKMRKVWSESEESTCIHPAHPAIFGSDRIMNSWRALFSGGRMPQLRATRTKVTLRGDVAWLTCCESEGSEPSTIEALNIFERSKDDGRWLMLHHGAAPVLPFFTQEQEPPKR